MNSLQLMGVLELGLLYGIVALGVYLTFRVLNFPDLTVDGSFPLGAAVSAALIVQDVSPFVATLAAIVAGSLAGFVTSYLHVRWRVLGLLAGILTMTALYSVNLRIMGKPNIALLTEPTIFNGSTSLFLPLLLIVIFIIVIIGWILKSQFGLALRAIGINPKVSPAYGINVGRMTIIGLCMSNGLVALAGSLFAQSHGFADISLGSGMLIMGLASVIVGETILPSRRIWLILISCILGSLAYRFAIALALNTQFAGLKSSDINLITSSLVVVALLIPRFRGKILRKLT